MLFWEEYNLTVTWAKWYTLKKGYLVIYWHNLPVSPQLSYCFLVVEKGSLVASCTNSFPTAASFNLISSLSSETLAHKEHALAGTVSLTDLKIAIISQTKDSTFSYPLLPTRHSKRSSWHKQTTAGSFISHPSYIAGGHNLKDTKINGAIMQQLFGVSMWVLLAVLKFTGFCKHNQVLFP